MTYGVRTWTESGAIEMDTDSFTYQVLHNQVYQLTTNAVITVPVPGFSPANCVAAILPTQAPTGDYASNAMPYQTVENGTIVIQSRHPNEPFPEGGSLIQFRLLVMRYKS